MFSVERHWRGFFDLRRWHVMHIKSNINSAMHQQMFERNHANPSPSRLRPFGVILKYKLFHFNTILPSDINFLFIAAFFDSIIIIDKMFVFLPSSRESTSLWNVVMDRQQWEGIAHTFDCLPTPTREQYEEGEIWK